MSVQEYLEKLLESQTLAPDGPEVEALESHRMADDSGIVRP